MLNSMTGFASAKGSGEGYSWTWDLRSVNSKGLDLRFRVPDWIEGLEAALRAELSKSLGRGSVTLNLRVHKDQEETSLALNRSTLDAVLTALNDVETEAMDRGMTFAPSKASDILALRGVLDAEIADQDTIALKKAILAELAGLINSFKEMRATEGAALETVLCEQIDQIASLTEDASKLVDSRADKTREALQANLAKVIENTDAVDPDRVAQELALIAVKADVTEELDRLKAHVDAARDLVKRGSPVGRKLDFLMQEFNREANTLCSKAQYVELTRIGLDLKAVIDQMREQVQNVE